MRNIQKKFLTLIENLAAEVGFEALDHPDFSNTGKVLIQDKTWKVCGIIKYDFQSYAADLSFAIPGQRAGVGVPVRKVYAEYERDPDAGARIHAFVRQVVAAVQQQ